LLVQKVNGLVQFFLHYLVHGANSWERIGATFAPGHRDIGAYDRIIADGLPTLAGQGRRWADISVSL
jgi:hypothetical protein